MKNIKLTIATMSALLFVHCSSEPAIKIDPMKFSAIKKVAVVQTIIDEPRVGADRNDGNWLIALMIEGAKKDFLAQKSYIETAHGQLANAISFNFASEFSKEYKLTVLNGAKFTASKEFTNLTKAIPIVPVQNTEDSIKMQLASGEQNFFQPDDGDFGDDPGLRFSRVFLREKPLAEVQRMSEILKVDGVAFITVAPKITVFSNVKYADAQIGFFIFDKTGTRVYQGSTFVRQKLEQGAGDMVSYKAMMDRVIASPATMLAEYKAEQQKK